jgi:hypothetical protein
VCGFALPEPIEVLVVSMFGDMVKIVGAGTDGAGPPACPAAQYSSPQIGAHGAGQ